MTIAEPMTVLVTVAVGDDIVDVYQFDYSARTVSRVAPASDAPDVSAVLKARLDVGTTHPRYVGRQVDEFRGITDSWNDSRHGAAAVCEDIGLTVTDWQFAES